MFRWFKPPMSQFLPVASCPATGHHWKEPGSILFAPFLPSLLYIDKITPQTSLLQAEQSQLSQPFLRSEMFQSLHHPDRSLMKMLNRIGPSIKPWGTPQVTGLQWDFVPLITTLWTRLFSHFSVHLTVCSISPYFISLSMRIFWKTVLNYWTPGRQQPLFFPHLPNQSFHRRRLSN